MVAEAALSNTASHDQDFYQGKLAAAEYFIRWELPLVSRDIAILTQQDTTCAALDPAYL
jgi:butyryl-CoA dehydrogenase